MTLLHLAGEGEVTMSPDKAAFSPLSEVGRQSLARPFINGYAFALAEMAMQ